jgi:LmbE family N-acetylglucosaminyl deacetylase
MLETVAETEPENQKSVAIIIAHPDDEILWAGGTILSHPTWKCFIVCLCRGNDTDRAPKFVQSLKALNAEGIMGDLDDGPEQFPQDEDEVAGLIINLLPPVHYDLIITHHPNGEYTRHVRHEETGKAVMTLCQTGKISTGELWTFAYEDGNKEYFPKPVETASIFNSLSKDIWLKKYRIITEVYGFTPDSWEAETTPKAEAFWKLSDPNISHTKR